MSKVVWHSEPEGKRYVVEFDPGSGWARSQETHRFKLFAIYAAYVHVSIGNRARVIDTKGDTDA